MKNKIITTILTILIIALPIAIMPGKTTYNIPKVWTLLIGGAILLILLLINYKKLELDKKDYVILIFALLVFISTICSSNIKISILGIDNRWEGMLAFYTYILIYFCAKKFLKYKDNKTLLNVLYGVYISISILGILQYYIKLPTNDLYPIFNKGTCGTFGNTNFMGSFISMGIPIFIITYIIKGDKISFITSLLVFFCLIACIARSGWVAFGIFSIILLIYLIKNKNKNFFKRTVILVVCFIMIFMLLYLPEKSIVKQKNKSSKKWGNNSKNKRIRWQIGF